MIVDEDAVLSSERARWSQWASPMTRDEGRRAYLGKWQSAIDAGEYTVAQVEQGFDKAWRCHAPDHGFGPRRQVDG